MQNALFTAAVQLHDALMKRLAIVQSDHLNTLACSAGSRKGRAEHAIVCQHPCDARRKFCKISHAGRRASACKAPSLSTPSFPRLRWEMTP